MKSTAKSSKEHHVFPFPRPVTEETLVLSVVEAATFFASPHGDGELSICLIIVGGNSQKTPHASFFPVHQAHDVPRVLPLGVRQRVRQFREYLLYLASVSCDTFVQATPNLEVLTEKKKKTWAFAFFAKTADL